MADENQQSTPRKRAPRKKVVNKLETSAEPAESDDAILTAADGSESGGEVMTATSQEVATSDGPGSDLSPESLREATVQEVNRIRIGQLVLHARERDITVVLDGDSAARVMSVFAGTGRRREMWDLMSPELSNMANLWVSVDLREVVAISWFPGLPSPADQVMTVDPPVPDALVP